MIQRYPWKEVGTATTTGAGWVNVPTNTLVKLANLSDGTTARGAGTEFLVNDLGRILIGASDFALVPGGQKLALAGPTDENIGFGVKAQGQGLASMGLYDLDNKSLIFTNFPTGFSGTENGLSRGNLARIVASKDNFLIKNSTGSIVFGIGSSSEAMRIQYSSGSVGIGTSNPATPLHVQGNAAGGDVAVLTLGNLNSTANSAVTLRFSPSNNPSTRFATIKGINTGNNNGIELSLSGSVGGVLSEGIRISTTGNVGIGTTTPTEKLEVNGAIKIGSTSAATPTAGTIRFNTTTSKFEGYNGTAWVEFH